VVPPESPLEQAVVASSQLQVVLARATVPVEAQLAIVGALASFSEEVLITWLGRLLSSPGRLPRAASEQLGTLVATRRWERAARYLAERLHDRRQDLLPAVQECVGLLGFVTRWLLGISTPTVSEKWAALEE